MKLSCARCSKVLALQIEVDGNTYTDEVDGDGLADEFEVSVKNGILMAVCADCTTPREAWLQLMRLASHMIEVCEEHLANMDMIRERIPALRDNPDMKADYARTQTLAAEYRARLNALLNNEPAE